MFITEDFVIGHIPKTAGHALAVMLHNAGVKPVAPFPFKIKNGKITSSNAKKHIKFDQVDCTGKKLFLVIRRLPTWLKSIYWHQSKHFVVNAKGNLQKIGLRSSYNKTFKQKGGHLPPPSILCHTIYPDVVISSFLETAPTTVSFLRMENLVDDLKEYLNLDVSQEDVQYSYSPPEKYWTKDTQESLYVNNPIWAEEEEIAYGDLLQI